VLIPYGHGTCDVPVLPGATVVRPTAATPLADPQSALRAALRDPLGCAPLAELAAGATSIAISVCDVTRPQPRSTMLPPLLDVLAAVAPNTGVKVLVATGTHRGNSPAELLEMLGADVLSRVEVINHDARDDSQLVDVGVTPTGVPVTVNRHWVDADVRITTGFVEPHFFAGFSGGPKLVVPGLAGLDTVLVLHDARRIASPLATWGRLEDNPVHADIRASAALAPPTFSCDVLLDVEQRITHVFAGALDATHEAACASARRHTMCAVDGEFDVVVTSNSGYPLDQNLYQAVKGLAAAERIVKPGGTIVLAAGCADGLPEHGLFGDLLAASSSLQELAALTAPSQPTRPDQWQVQILARVLARSRVLAYADGLTRQELASAFITKIDDLEEGIAQAARDAGPDARICYLPGGPVTIPYLTEKEA
jgi:nickel-dependent lactate racemase